MAANLPNAQALHGDIAQSSREVTLDSFRKGKINVLVATDVAARGLDIPEVSWAVCEPRIFLLSESVGSHLRLERVASCGVHGEEDERGHRPPFARIPDPGSGPSQRCRFSL